MPPARRPGIVLDTNVIVSGVLSRNGPPSEILHAWHARQFTLVLTDKVNREYHRVLSEARSNRKLNLRGFDVSLFRDLLTMDAAWVEDDIAPIIRSRDPNDDQLLFAALNGNADILVTGDIDLLELAGDTRLGSLRILTPRDFLDELKM